VNQVQSSGVEDEAYHSGEHSEFQNGLDVPEKLLPPHVVARWEDDRWQDQVEEDLVAKLHILEDQCSVLDLGAQSK
jgi:hypothetical protein